MGTNLCRLLHVFENNVRIEIVKLLLQFEWRSLSDIAEQLENYYGRKITLPGVLKHMKELEAAGIVRHEPGIYAKKPDARKTIYLLEGKERVEKILYQLENNVGKMLQAGMIFSETAKLAREIQGMGSGLQKDEKKQFESMIAQCESSAVADYLTDNERKKVKLWKMMIVFLE